MNTNLYHLHKYEMSFSVVAPSQLYNVWILLTNTFTRYLSEASELANLSMQHFHQPCSCVTCDLWQRDPSCWKNLTFIQDWWQIVLQQLDVFGTMQVAFNLKFSWTITFFVSLKYQIFILKFQFSLCNVDHFTFLKALWQILVYCKAKQTTIEWFEKHIIDSDRFLFHSYHQRRKK